jgi:hypothetical protein
MSGMDVVSPATFFDVLTEPSVHSTIVAPAAVRRSGQILFLEPEFLADSFEPASCLHSSYSVFGRP